MKRLFEFLERIMGKKPKPIKPTPVPVPTPTPIPDPVPTPIPDPIPEPTPEPIPVPDPVPVPTPTPEPVPEPTPIPSPEPVPTPPPINVLNAPLSITNPVVGIPLVEQWSLQFDGATGPRHNFLNGKWNTKYSEAPKGTGVSGTKPNDPYLASLGFIYNNYGDLWIPFQWNNPGGVVVVADYDFDGAPTLSFWGDKISVLITDCANFNSNVGADVNRNPAGEYHLVNFQIAHCDMNTTRWDLLCKCAFELGPYNRIRNQVQELGFGGGYMVMYFVGINCHHNYITGGGCNAPDGSHIELWQHLVNVPGTGSYTYVEDNMFDFTKDGQPTTKSRAGWTGVISEGGCIIRWCRNIVKGVDVCSRTLAVGGGMGTIIALGDENIRLGTEINDNAMSCSPIYGYTYKHGGGDPLVVPSAKGNRTFRDEASNGLVGPADNVEITKL